MRTHIHLYIIIDYERDIVGERRTEQRLHLDATATRGGWSRLEERRSARGTDGGTRETGANGYILCLAPAMQTLFIVRIINRLLPVDKNDTLILSLSFRNRR